MKFNFVFVRGVSYMTWQNEDKVVEKTEVFVWCKCSLFLLSFLMSS